MNDEFWVFAYGSLMWRPDFSFAEAQSAFLRGYHRSLCVLSMRYRGTAEAPGLVLGLDRGGSCRGRAFRVLAEDGPAVLDYLHERELVTDVYRPQWLPVCLEDGRRIPAYGFVVRRDHPQYAGRLGFDDTARLVRQGVGSFGTARDYLANTVAHLTEMGIREGSLHRLLALVDAMPAGTLPCSEMAAALA